MRVSKERLSVIGRLIGIYREERRDNTQNEYTQKRFCDGICSPNTLKNIEAGGLSRSEDIYIELLDKLGLKYGEFPAIDEAIDEIVEEIYNNMEIFNRDEINVLSNKCLRLLEKVKDYAYYSETYQILSDLRNYYKNIIMIDDKNVERYIQLVSNQDTLFGDLIRLLIFAKVQSLSITNKVLYVDVMNKIGIERSNKGFIRIMFMHYCFVQNDYVTMSKLVIELEDKFVHTSNNIRLLDVYNYAVNLYGTIEKEELNTYVDKIEKLIESNVFPALKLAEVYSNIASALHHNKRYSEALDYYEKMLMNYNDGFIPKFLYMADCQNHLGQKINIPKVEHSRYEKFPIEVRLMYKYFTLPDDTPLFVKQNYIMKRILPLLSNTVNIEIFRYELCRIIEETGHYKNIHIFEQVVNNNLSEISS